MNEVTKIEASSTPTIAAEDQMLALVERVITNPDLPMERVKDMMDLRERQLAKEAEQAFNAAFASAMAEMPDVPRTGENKDLGRKYATLDDLIRTARPVLSRHGLSLNWQTGVNGEAIWVRGIVRHALGHSISTEQQGPRDRSGSMNALQGGGSTETYLKRYTGFAILGVSSGDEVDDDGYSAGQKQNQNIKPRTQFWADTVIADLPENASDREKAEAIAAALIAQWKRKNTFRQLANEWDRRESIIEGERGLEVKHPDLWEGVASAYEERAAQLREAERETMPEVN